MVIFGTYPRVVENKNISIHIICNKCNYSPTYLVMIERIPHLFFIPILFLHADRQPALFCPKCNTMYSLKDKIWYLVEQFYDNKISIDTLKKELQGG
jgi:hypothetical protein